MALLGTLIIGIPLVVFILTFATSFFTDSGDLVGRALNAFGEAFSIAFSFLFVTLVITFFFTMSLDLEPDHSKDIKRSIPIVSVDISHGNNGSFILGTGRFGSNEKYVFYRVNTNGTYSREYVNIKSEISETDEQPRYEYDLVTYSLPKWWTTKFGVQRQENETIYVPYGTVVKHFKLD